ncbi:MAG: hypothetical protein RBU37_07355 [Myxococcota bacterium]|jgi:hypothetical protein|nr:hypothetical protein [Myxococcota bacterium]
MIRIEHCARRVHLEDLSYWMSMMGNSGWRVLHCVPFDGSLVLLAERSFTSLEQRLRDEMRYARGIEELHAGLLALLGAHGRPTMPVAAVQLLSDEEGERLHVGLWAGGQVFDEMWLPPQRQEWDAAALLRVMQCADNILPVFKIGVAAIREALRRADAIDALRALLGHRASLTPSSSGRSVQVCRGDEERFHKPWGGRASAQLVIQAAAGEDPPWTVIGQAQADVARSIAAALPGCEP